MTAVTLQAVSAHRAHFQVPTWGLWWADLEFAEDPEIAVDDVVSGSVGGQDFLATVIASGSDGGSGYGARLVGGYGGWMRTIPAKPYRNDLGVSVATILGDAARACGEVIDTSTVSARVGPHFSRREGGAYHTLNGLAPAGWYVDFDGVTHIGLRPEVPYAGTEEVLDYSPTQRVLDLDVESVAGLVPGAVLIDAFVASDVSYTLEGRSLQARLHMQGAPANRRVAALARILDALDPFRLYRGSFEYRLISQSGNRCDVQPVRAGLGLPALEGVPVRFSPDVRAQMVSGAVVLVTFVDGDPSRPCVIAGDSPDSPAVAFLSYEIGGPGALPVAYLGSAVQVDPLTGIGAVTLGSTRVKVVP